MAAQMPSVAGGRGASGLGGAQLASPGEQGGKRTTEQARGVGAPGSGPRWFVVSIWQCRMPTAIEGPPGRSATPHSLVVAANVHHARRRRHHEEEERSLFRGLEGLNGSIIDHGAQCYELPGAQHACCCAAGWWQPQRTWPRRRNSCTQLINWGLITLLLAFFGAIVSGGLARPATLR